MNVVRKLPRFARVLRCSFPAARIHPRRYRKVSPSSSSIHLRFARHTPMLSQRYALPWLQLPLSDPSSRTREAKANRTSIHISSCHRKDYVSRPCSSPSRERKGMGEKERSRLVIEWQREMETERNRGMAGGSTKGWTSGSSGGWRFVRAYVCV